MKTLTFQNITLTPIKTDSQIWLSSADLAKALGYAQSRAVTKLYNENSDEFNSSMTQVIETTCNNLKRSIRIFSLRGCHLIAMFSRTTVAKQFRQWVLDILDKEVGQPTIQKTTVDERIPLKNAVNLLVAKGSLNYSECYKLVHQYMGVNHIDEIPLDDLPKAVAYIHRLILCIDQNNPDNQTETNEMWRIIGQLRHRAIQEEIIKLKIECGEFYQKLQSLQSLTGMMSDVFAYIDLKPTKEQRQSAYQKAIGGHQRNLTMHGFIN